MYLLPFLATSGLAIAYVAVAWSTAGQIALACLSAIAFSLAIFVKEWRATLTLILLYIATVSNAQTTSFAVLSGNLSFEHYLRLAILVAVSVLLAPKVPGIISKVISCNKASINCFMAYALFCLLSTLWSEAPLVTLGKSVELITGFFVVAAALVADAPKAALLALFRYSIMFIVFSIEVALLGYLVDPTSNVQFSMIARNFFLSSAYLSISSDGISRYGAIISIVALSYLLQTIGARRRFDLFVPVAVLMLGILAQALTVGRTGIVSFVISLAALSVRRPFFAASTAPIVAIVLLGYSEQIFSFLSRGQNIYQIYNLSGRVDWWMYAIQGFMESPIFGVGFGVAGRVLLSNFEIYDVTGLHNGFLEVLTGVGIVGFALWLVPFVSYLAKSTRLFLNHIEEEVNILVIPMFISTFLSEGPGGWMSVEYGIYLIALFIHTLPYTKAETRGETIHSSLERTRPKPFIYVPLSSRRLRYK